MENFIFIFISISISSLILYGLLRIVYAFWWRPKSLEKHFRQQGIGGTSYSLFHDDTEEIIQSSKEAWSKPMPLNHHISPYVLPFFHQMMQKYGKVSMSWMETKPRLTVADPELIKLVLNDKFGQFIKPPLNPLVHILQEGVAQLEGEKWAKRRRLITAAFHLEKLKGMEPAFSRSCFDLINRWKKFSSLGTCELDVVPEFHNLAGDVISRTAFGSSYEEGKKIFEFQKEQATLVLEAYYSFYFPGLRFIPTKKNRRRYHLDKEIKATLREIIHKKEQTMKNNRESSNHDLLGLLLQKTTAIWLTWTMILLSMNPNWQEKARQEVLSTCGKKMPNIENLNHLKIVSMILHEVLRLYRPITATSRYTSKNAHIGGISIPPGVDVQLPFLFLHYDPKYWGDDVEEFKPERFAEGVSKASKDQLAFYPFGWGPRICLGMNFALTEAKMALAMILQHFSFELSPSYTHSPYTVITLQPQHGAPIILHQI
ncbi:hypothetical protein Patl1_13776 [Pistacia atlantica]|uniref:Uncharacterized protein n=1 Tax=Pistacia atlantica TaxID=434234 RepID=A0ACC1AT81_9ROSI|nr:hypothetical protein Patl1_13776 [Pistacia atlantica]